MADKINSFVEGINLVANAATLAQGDLVEDTQEARDLAVQAAEDAVSAEVRVEALEVLAQNWAEKGHNNPVQGENGSEEYSAYHWAVEASVSIGDPLINDSIISDNYTWSSTKISTEVSEKSDIGHLHGGVYEPVISKSTAFNKDFNGTGVATTIARSDHNHTGIYEPKIVHATAFNKDFGTTSGTVMEGDRNFDTVYEPKRTSIGTAYNKNFTSDTNNLSADEIPRATHIHPADKITYENSSTSIGSSTVQGAITQLSSSIDEVTIAEKSYITLQGQIQYTQQILAQNTPTKLMMPIPSIQAKQHASNNANAEITLEYTSTEIPAKATEGTYIVNLVLSNTENFAINVGINDVLYGEATVGVGSLSLAHYLTSLDITGINSGSTSITISLWLTNLDNTNDAIVESCNIMWEGAPQGALVASGSTVNHSDITGTGMANGVHTTSDIHDLDNQLDGKTVTVAYTANNFAIFDANGDLGDSGVASGFEDGLMSKVGTPTLDNIVSMDSTGNSKNSETKVSDLATKNGDSTEVFEVANGTSGNDAVNYTQLDAVQTSSDGNIPKVSSPTVGSFPVLDVGGVLVDSAFSSSSFATTVHTHTIANITSLQDTLDNKYSKVVTPVTGNAVSFDAGGVLQDSGVTLTGEQLIGESI